MYLVLYFTRHYSLCCMLPLCFPIVYYNKIHNSATTKAEAIKLDWLMLLIYFRLSFEISLNFQVDSKWILIQNYSCNIKLFTLCSSSVFLLDWLGLRCLLMYLTGRIGVNIFLVLKVAWFNDSDWLKIEQAQEKVFFGN